MKKVKVKNQKQIDAIDDLSNTILFVDRVFEGDLNLDEKTVGGFHANDATFKGGFFANCATFEGYFSASCATFEGYFSASYATFEGYFSASYATFEGDFFVTETTFEGDFFVTKTAFGGDFAANSATFGGVFFAHYATFGGVFSAPGATFKEGFYADEARFDNNKWMQPISKKEKDLAIKIISGSFSMDTWHSDGEWYNFPADQMHTCGTAHCLAGGTQAYSDDPEIRAMEPREAGEQVLPGLKHLFFMPDEIVKKYVQEVPVK